MKLLILFFLPICAFASAVDSMPPFGDEKKPVEITIETNSFDVVVNVIHTPVIDETEIDYNDVAVKGFPPFLPLNYPHISHAEFDAWLRNKYATWLCENSGIGHEDVFTCEKLKYSNVPASQQDIIVAGYPTPLPDNFPFPSDDRKNEFAHKYAQWRCISVTTKNEQIAACNRWLPVLNSLKIGVDELGQVIE